MEIEFQRLTSMLDLIQAAETYGYDPTIRALIPSFQIPSVEGARIGTGTSFLHDSVVASMEAHTDNFDTKFDEGVVSIQKDLNAVKKKVRLKKTANTADGTAYFLSALMGIITGCQHALFKIDSIISDVKYTVNRSYNRQAADISGRRSGAIFAQKATAAAKRDIDMQMVSLRADARTLVNLRNQIPGLGDLPAFHQAKDRMIRTARVADRLDSAQAAMNAKASRVVKETQSLLDNLKYTRTNAMKSIGLTAVPIARRIGIFALMVLIHSILWFILFKVIKMLVDKFEK